MPVLFSSVQGQGRLKSLILNMMHPSEVKFYFVVGHVANEEFLHLVN